MSCCNSDDRVEVDRDAVRVYDDKSVTATVEYGLECNCCGESELVDAVDVEANFKHGCRQRAKLQENHYSVSEVDEPTGSYPDFSLDVKIYCNGCGETFPVVLKPLNKKAK